MTYEIIGHDLDPNATGDLTQTISIEQNEALLISANSTDGNNWSASVRWIDTEADDNEFVSESKTDIQLDTVSNDWARLTRKSNLAEVTITSEETAGTQNQVNAFVGVHR